ncbi:hypothetical protein PHYPSEUDO_009747 [Phytophthora pseudosyringae]|uniref:SGNH hydrolase-type esterase domain-containing protein n=1 Tax=Phytophthora pseudosyringae TaxID=221518 RepID=A0A8T1VF13_9STRA|nr:hypothetical protein PHYPSEUDO_009747 [Phytophthora pseudosyringae]
MVISTPASTQLSLQLPSVPAASPRACMKPPASVNPDPIPKFRLCRATSKRNKAYLAIAAVLAVAVVIAGTDPSNGGWVTLLQAKYTRSADTVARGLGGYNTSWFVKYAMPVILREIYSHLYTPALVTVWLGANDAALANGSNAERHVPIDLYTANLVQIVKSFSESVPAVIILLVTPPHIDDAVRHKYSNERSDSKRGQLDRSNVMAANYARACVEAANYLGVLVLDLHAYFNEMPASTRNAL